MDQLLRAVIGCCTEKQAETQNAQENLSYEHPNQHLTGFGTFAFLEDLCGWYIANNMRAE